MVCEMSVRCKGDSGVNLCECCGKKTRVKGFWGVYICKSCQEKYENAQKLALWELLNKHRNEYEKILDEKIKEVFK